MGKWIAILSGVFLATAMGCASLPPSQQNEGAASKVVTSQNASGAAMTLDTAGPVSPEIMRIPCKTDATEHRPPSAEIGYQQTLTAGGESRPFVRYDCDGH